MHKHRELRVVHRRECEPQPQHHNQSHLSSQEPAPCATKQSKSRQGRNCYRFCDGEIMGDSPHEVLWRDERNYSPHDGAEERIEKAQGQARQKNGKK